MRRISLLQLLLVAHYLAPGIKTIEGFLVRNGRIVAHGYPEQRPQFSRFDTPAAPSDVPANEPQLLQPFLPAADPKWSCRGPVGEGTFVIRREGGPTREELCNENIIQIVRLECSDLEVNTLVWKCLGYRFEEDEWTTAECFPNWREKHPTPPDFIGMQRIYSPEIDKPSLRANQDLVRSIPLDNKQSLKEHLKPLGFRGYQYSELTPNKTRRAQCANWLIYYREELFGYTVEELRERRRRKQEAATAQQASAPKEDDWTPPVTPVY